MYINSLPADPKTSTIVAVRYDCCGKNHKLKWKDADKNFQKNAGKHICRTCGLKTNNPASRPEVREKMKATNLERHGSTVACNKPEHVAARVQKMFGTEEAKRDRTEKIKQTNLERYGVEHAAQADHFKEKTRQVWQEKYGTDHPMQNDAVKEKARDAIRERYGVDSVLSLPEVRLKAAQTSLEKYGVEHYNQLPEMKDYLRDNCRQWLAESYEAGGPMKGIVRPEEWNEKQRETVAKLIDEGRWYAGCLYGTYQGTRCKRPVATFRSSYELKVHWHLDHSDDVEWYDYEPFQVPYYDTEGKKRHYTVDFVVGYKNRDRLVALEIKNNYTRDQDLNRSKYLAFEEQCSSVIDLEVWANDEIKNLGLDLNVLLKETSVTVLKG